MKLPTRKVNAISVFSLDLITPVILVFILVLGQPGVQLPVETIVQRQLSSGAPKASHMNTVAPAAATPAIAASPTATPQPQNSNAGFPLYATLRKGSSCDDVKQLQNRLTELGYYTGAADGDFGSETAAAVKAFQVTNNLHTDGIAGAKTQEALYSDDAIPASEPVITQVRKICDPPSRGQTQLHFGDSGEEVKHIQARLINLGYLSGTANGRFDEATQAAVAAFQKSHFLHVDGVANDMTLAKLYSTLALKNTEAVAIASAPAAAIPPTPKPKSQSTIPSVIFTLTHETTQTTPTISIPQPQSTKTEAAYETLRFGSSGEGVRHLQRRLKELGFFTGAENGEYGLETMAAVEAYQIARYLPADGIANSKTQDYIFSFDTFWMPRTTNTQTNRPTATPRYSEGRTDIYLRDGNAGEQVKIMQTRLIELRYLEGTADGYFGISTQAAVAAFQKDNSLFNDGVADPHTLVKLYHPSAKMSKVAAAGIVPYRRGRLSSEVGFIQQQLRRLGYYAGEINWEFDAETEAAVIAFQTDNGIEADGIVGAETMEALINRTD